MGEKTTNNSCNCNSDDECYVNLCFSTCYLAQITHIIAQIIKYYRTERLVITMESGKRISGYPGQLHPIADSGLFQLVNSHGIPKESVSLCKIAAISIPNAYYNNGITYAPQKDFTIGCDEVCESAIRKYLIIGSNRMIMAAGKTVANGIIHAKAYGIVVVVDTNNKSPVFVSTSKVESVK